MYPIRVCDEIRRTFWSHILVACFGRTFRSHVSFARFGRTFWSHVSVARFRRTFPWKKAIRKNETRLWSRFKFKPTCASSYISTL